MVGKFTVCCCSRQRALAHAHTLTSDIIASLANACLDAIDGASARSLYCFLFHFFAFLRKHLFLFVKHQRVLPFGRRLAFCVACAAWLITWRTCLASAALYLACCKSQDWIRRTFACFSFCAFKEVFLFLFHIFLFRLLLVAYVCQG